MSWESCSQRTSKLVEYNGMTLGVLKTAQLRKMYRLGCLANLYSGCVVSLVVAGVAVSKRVPAMLRGVPDFPPFRGWFPESEPPKIMESDGFPKGALVTSGSELP